MTPADADSTRPYAGDTYRGECLLGEEATLLLSPCIEQECRFTERELFSLSLAKSVHSVARLKVSGCRNAEKSRLVRKIPCTCDDAETLAFCHTA